VVIAQSAWRPGYGLKDPGYDSWQMQKKFFSLLHKRPDRPLVPLSFQSKGYRRYLLGLKGPKIKFVHTPVSNVELKNNWTYNCSPSVRLPGVDSLTLYVLEHTWLKRN
jgi:hypothetical protein